MSNEAAQPAVPARSHPAEATALPSLPPPEIPDHELLRCIGRGSYGEVWLARNVLGDYRAVKVVYRRSFEGIKKFEPVSRTHDSQVDILHVGRNERAGYFYYVMELADPVGEGASEGDGALGLGSGENQNHRRQTQVPRPQHPDPRETLI